MERKNSKTRKNDQKINEKNDPDKRKSIITEISKINIDHVIQIPHIKVQSYN